MPDLQNVLIREELHCAGPPVDARAKSRTKRGLDQLALEFFGICGLHDCMTRLLFLLFCSFYSLSAGTAITGKVLSVNTEAKTLTVEVGEGTTAEFNVGESIDFRVSRGDLEIGYEGRRIRANASYYAKAWHLEQIFPLDGAGANVMQEVNRRFHEATASMSRRKYIKEGEYIPNFAMIDQNGDFLQIRELRGKAFVLNFIFTRCAAPTMCPASSTRMEALQEQARKEGMEALHFVTISFDPAFDSPGTLRSYANGYGFELDNYHLLTGTQELIDDLLRQFGILTVEEDGTINHTMATLLIDQNGRVAYRREGPSWKAESFLREARQLFEQE